MSEGKTRRELEALVWGEVSKARECEGIAGVTISGIDDPGMDFTWVIASIRGDPTKRSRIALATIVTLLQRQYDLLIED